MKNNRYSARLLSVIALSFLASILVGNSALATGVITKPNLSGNWQIALNGKTGCGLASMLVNVTLNSSAVGTNATTTTHGECGDSVISGNTFQVLTLAGNGRGTANLSCGVGCGWNFIIQVSPDRSMFSLVDVDPVNPGNYLSGIAIHQ